MRHTAGVSGLAGGPCPPAIANGLSPARPEIRADAARSAGLALELLRPSIVVSPQLVGTKNLPPRPLAPPARSLTRRTGRFTAPVPALPLQRAFPAWLRVYPGPFFPAIPSPGRGQPVTGHVVKRSGHAGSSPGFRSAVGRPRPAV